MPAPLFRHFRATNPAGVSVVFDVTGVVPAGRALIVSKVTLNDLAGGVHAIAIIISPTADLSGFVTTITIGAGETYAETGLVVLAGERLYARTSNGGATTLACNVFGQEVDNV